MIDSRGTPSPASKVRVIFCSNIDSSHVWKIDRESGILGSPHKHKPSQGQIKNNLTFCRLYFYTLSLHRYLTLSPETMGLIDQVNTNERMFTVLGALSGVSIHHGAFIHGEWHNQAPNILRAYAATFGCVAISWLFSERLGLGSFIQNIMVASIMHILALFSSILIYRRFFHRLNKSNLPGPGWARYTKIWHIWENRDSRNHLYLHKLFQKYGDVVRTGNI